MGSLLSKRNALVLLVVITLLGSGFGTIEQLAAENRADPGDEVATAPEPAVTPAPTPTPTPTATPDDPGGGGSDPSTATTPVPEGSTGTATTTTADSAVVRSMTVHASDPARVVTTDGRPGGIVGSLDGQLTLAAGTGADTLVLVVQTWSPDDGWQRVLSRQDAVDGRTAVDLGSAFAYPVTYLDATRTGGFANPVPGTTANRTGHVAVTAVLFDGEREIGRRTTETSYEVAVRHSLAGGGSLSVAASGDDAELGSSNGGGTRVSLSVGDGSSGSGDSVVVVPGDSWERRVSVENTGDLDGELRVAVENVVDHENGITDGEAAADDTPSSGELSDELRVRISLVNGTERRYLVGDAEEYVDLRTVAESGYSSRDGRLVAGERGAIVVEWRLESGATNAIQGDGVSVDFSLSLTQSPEA